MATMTFNIPLPVLQAGESFKYRYKPVGGAYGGYSSTATQTITLSGVSTGSYILEVIFVEADLTECNPVLIPFTVVAPFTCFSFFPSIIQSGSQYVLQINYTLPSPNIAPSCGWSIQYTPNGYATQTVTYTTLPTSGQINIILPANVNTGLTIIASICNTLSQFCYEGTVPKKPVPDCTPLILTGYDLQYNVAGNFWKIRLFVTNSNPITPLYQISYQETSVLSPGATPDSGTYLYQSSGGGGSAQLYTIPLNGSLNPQGIYLQNPGFPTEFLPNCIKYSGSIVDICGRSHYFEVSGFWTPSGAAGQGVFIDAPC